MRIITIDNGNSNPHIGIFKADKLQSIIPLHQFTKNEGDYILVSSVGKPLPDIFAPSFDLKTKRKIENGKFSFFNMPVNYSETLGDDRIISAYFVFEELLRNQFNEKILLIDAGTFITMDFIDQKGFSGGYIFPGTNLFLASYQSGLNLKALTPHKLSAVVNELPHSTEEAILGATHSYLESILKEMITKHDPKKIIITGGSLEIIKEKILKFNLPAIQIETNPHLIHLALFSIYKLHLLPISS